MEYSLSELDSICDDWVRLLTQVLGWPRTAAIAWARDRIALADNAFFSHETTSWYVLPLIITDDVRRRTRSLGELESRIDLVLERFRQSSSSDVRREKVEHIRNEIREIIAAHTAPPE